MAMRVATDRVALLNIEATYGTPAVAMGAAQAILLMESEIQPMADKLDRVVDRPFFGGDPFVLVGKRIQLTAKCDILGAGALALGTAAPLGKLYRITQHAETLDHGVSTTYNPISRNIESATVDFFWAGIKFRMLGVRGTVDFDFTVKQYAVGSVTLTGMLTVAPADGEAPAGIDWSAFQTPAAIESTSWTVQLGGVDICAQQLTLQQNATVELIECSNGLEVMVTARKPAGVLRVFKDATLATWNPFAIAESQAVVTLQNTITKAAGLNVSMPIRAQLEYPKPTEIQGIAGFEIPYVAVPTGAGNDEYSFEFT